MPRVTEPSFQFWFDEKWYTTEGAKTMARTGTKDDLATMRAEYTRMRDVAQKRIKRLEKQFPESKAYLRHQKGFAKLRELDPRDFPKAFSELAKFVKAKASTVSGQKAIKAKTIKTWQEQGIDLNPKNYDMAIKILEELRHQKLIYGSDKVRELADVMLHLDDSKINQWLDNLDSLIRHTDQLQMIPITELNGYSMDEVLELLGE